MIWQTAPPREWVQGEYWWIETKRDGKIIVRVDTIWGSKLADLERPGSDLSISVETWTDCCDFDHTPLRWSGPIPMPEEPNASAVRSDLHDNFDLRKWPWVVPLEEDK